MSGNDLTPKKFDRMAVTAGAQSEKIIWTLKGIASRIGCGPDFVRDVIAKAEGSPVRMLGRTFYAFEPELIEFLKSDRNKPA